MYVFHLGADDGPVGWKLRIKHSRFLYNAQLLLREGLDPARTTRGSVLSHIVQAVSYKGSITRENL